MKQVVIIGGGAAGLLAGIAAVTHGAAALIVEKMLQPGKKMLITGKGRCNITNNCELQEFINNLPGNGRFLYSALRQFSNRDMVALLESHGLVTKLERGGRIFPVSDKAGDVVATLVKIFTGGGGILQAGTTANRIICREGRAVGVQTTAGFYAADAVILAAGGSSYPGTGSDGSGVRLAAAVGHSITPLKPSLVPLVSDHPYLAELQGLSLRNVNVTLLADEQKLAAEFGEMLFTHFGFSGPVILSLSNSAAKALAAGSLVELAIDLKPALSAETLDARIQRDFIAYGRRQLLNGLKDLLPHSLIAPVCDLAYLDGAKPVAQVARAERARLVQVLKAFILPVTDVRPLSEAIVTAGGVAVKEVNPKTMESKLVRGLYLAGEVLDVDGYTGGFNLQAAFSAGYAAGSAAARQEVNQ